MTQENIDVQPSSSAQLKAKKAPKRGILYLSTIPPYMNVSKIREIFSEYGTVGKIYLELAATEINGKAAERRSKKHKVSRRFKEGWVEFERKSVAKKVAALLNNTQVNNRKKSKQYDCIWSMKYLKGFKWIHLNERLSYEKAARKQKLKTEMESSKKTANAYSSNLNKGSKGKKNISYVNQEYENLSTTMDTDVATNDSEKPEIPQKMLHSFL